MFDLDRLDAAAAQVYAVMPPTPQYCWPLLSERVGAEVWVKHENHTPIGSFKVRGGLVYMDDLMKREPALAGVITATSGNHGQSVCFAAKRAGISATLVVPTHISDEKVSLMRARGGEIVRSDGDSDDAIAFAAAEAERRGLHRFPSYHPLLVLGVASFSLELMRGVADLDAVYVPIGLGSEICGAVAARDALGLGTRIIGVVAEGAPTYIHSFAARKPVPTNSADTIAEGLAIRIPDPDALAIICAGVERIVGVSDAEILTAVRHYHTDTHNLAEASGAAPLAALLKEREAMAGKRVAVVLSGGNISRALYLKVLSEA